VCRDPASRPGPQWEAAASADRPRPLNLDTGSRIPGPVYDREGNQPMAQSNTPSRTSANDEAHWRKTTNLMLIHLGIWVFFGYIVHMFVKPLNKIIIPILDFPLGFYMAAQGSLIVFVVMLFLFAKQQNKIDREFGVAEDE
jgi:putative solute:sodium symporter small subunit